MKMTALKNRMNKFGDYEYKLSNNTDGDFANGCSGFITNPANGKIVYVQTEESSYEPLSDKVMYREAKHLEDYTGGQNQWSPRKNDKFMTIG